MYLIVFINFCPEKTISLVVYFTASFPYIMLFCLLVRGKFKCLPLLFLQFISLNIVMQICLFRSYASWRRFRPRVLLYLNKANSICYLCYRFRFYLKPDFSKLLESKVWVDAVTQVFIQIWIK